ncbi:hypothetical protein ZIOFF_014372 [Zingiber officinale]|uniref:Transcription factor CBF/NF-Y/archaeal histone domain-containing protein n=2 Tax=Zingiber officinale TaxID=94328 RepID=A0A8J5HW58_ZINOF|nr:hypothetical protein ZIOFF_014372 [Zingiber officinale]
MASGAGLLGSQQDSLPVVTGAGRGGDARSTVAEMEPTYVMGGGGQPYPPPAAQTPAVREQDRFMPIANVIRIMRRVLPAHAKIADDAKEMIQECVSEYISFITSEANERCQREQRKTVTADDVLWAMRKLGFDDYLEPLSLFLHRYRELEAGGAASDPSSAGHRALPGLHLPKHHRSAAAPVPDMSAPVSQFFAAPPPQGFLMPTAPPPAQPINLMSDSMVGYFLNMYGAGGGGEAGPSSASTGSGGYNLPNFEHPFPHK